MKSHAVRVFFWGPLKAYDDRFGLFHFTDEFIDADKFLLARYHVL